MQCFCHIHITLINTVRLHIRCILFQDFLECTRTPLIQTIIGRHHIQLRTFHSCLSNGLPCTDTIFFRGMAFRQYNSMPGFGIACHSRRNLPQVHRCPQMMEPICRFPRQKRAIDVYMKNNPFQTSVRLLFPILYTNIYSYARRKFFRFIKLNYFQTMHMIKKKGIKDIHKEL